MVTQIRISAEQLSSTSLLHRATHFYEAFTFRDPAHAHLGSDTPALVLTSL